MKNKIVPLQELSKIVSDLQRNGYTVGGTGGCFDILHAGHVMYLEQAREKVDKLILLLNSDASVKRLKGESRPINNEADRAFVIAGLQCVDYVSVFEEDTPCEAICVVKPNVWIKGADYRDKRIPEMDVLDTYGGSLEFIDMLEGRSSTGIIERIKSAQKENSEVRA